MTRRWIAVLWGSRCRTSSTRSRRAQPSTLRADRLSNSGGFYQAFEVNLGFDLMVSVFTDFFKTGLKLSQLKNPKQSKNSKFPELRSVLPEMSAISRLVGHSLLAPFGSYYFHRSNKCEILGSSHYFSFEGQWLAALQCFTSISPNRVQAKKLTAIIVNI